ncbi:hypothetical protein GPALN_013231 [Globodera pallida]|nr:hypothetical protein GPALN_013231 [Globodera pallida]
MKHFFFKKALPNSTSFDSTLAGQAKPKTFTDNNNSIDKPQKSAQQQRPTTLFPISESPTTSFGHQHPATHGGQLYVPCTPSSALDHQHLHQLSSPISCSSTQGTIGCAIGNELFDQCRSSWQIMPLENATTPNAAQCPAALLNCRQPLLMLPPPPPPAGSTSPQQQQVSDLVCTLVQQLSAKDAEIGRLKTALRRSREVTERERERHGDVQGAAREQISRMRRRLRTYETELEIAQRVHRQATIPTSSEANVEAKFEKLMVDHAQLQSQLAHEKRAVTEREAAWERERTELNQTVQSLNSTLEELELELRQREVHGREMQLQLERAVVEREMACMELAKDQQQKKQSTTMVQMLNLHSPKAESATDECCTAGGGGPSLSSSSGIDSSLADAKEFDLKSMRLARRQLIECRRKVARLVKSAEKTQRGERLGRDDLFGSSVQEDSTLCCSVGVHSSTQAQLDEHVTQIGALRKEMEVLHDKFIILYARGTF